MDQKFVDAITNVRMVSGTIRIDLNITGQTDDNKLQFSKTGEIILTSLNITSVSNVDGASSTKVRVTVIPKSNDIVPVRNQILEIDLVNSVISGSVDAQATTGKGYTVTSTGTTTTTTVTTSSSTPTSSAY